MAYLFSKPKSFQIVVFAVSQQDALKAAYAWRQQGYKIKGKIDPATFDNPGLSISSTAYAAVMRSNLEKLCGD